ncbi:GAP family protein [Synechococcus sp. CCY9202]|uniref:GAP family protein n=1 Tax=Synechococcus sp. CCY9202 TaxID=174698 RepID=UPI002B1EA22C|nr:GAP family protein [Synechococcus sp. CCY9202]MEA5424229.1 GAP family protein [Synechococcus sp. CCY9202]
MVSLSLLVEILPLALGAAVSPLVLILQVMLLGRSTQGLGPSWGFAAGASLVVAGWTLAGLLLGHALPPRTPGPDPVAAVVHLVLALLLLTLGLAIQQGRLVHASVVGAEGAPLSVRRGLLIGTGSMATNLTSLVLFLPALQDLARAQPSLPTEVLLVGLMALITLLPALAPPALVWLWGAPGRRTLERLAPWMAQHQRRIQALLCFGFAGFLALKGISGL